jgi:aminomethyltransferase
MPVPTPFHPRTSDLCHSLHWKEWSGYYAVCSYDTCHEREYFALRHAAGLIDVSPLFKADLRGPDAAALLSLVTVRDLSKLRVGRVTYLCWCDDDGKVVDDGTVTRLDEQHYRLTGNGPLCAWLARYSDGLKVDVEDTTEQYGALALQGPLSRAILVDVVGSAVEKLRFFRAMNCKIGDIPVLITRTGYTGDLGYEIWVGHEEALAVWDRLMAAGKAYRLQPAGLDAMDVTRVEAGFVLCGVDYFPAQHCLLDSRKSSPYEIGLGWTVHLDHGPFVGQQALRAELQRGPVWSMVGLDYDWDEYETLLDSYGLPPQVSSSAWRDAVPVFDRRGRQIGQATSGAWSPILKKNLALATLASAHAEPGTRVQVEVTVEYERRKVGATVVRTPFFDPPRKKA